MPSADDRLAKVLGDLGDADAHLLDPPADLWGRIASAVASDPEGPTGAGGAVEYCIDAHDVIVHVGGDWDRFAAANEGEELVGSATGSTLWDSIADDRLSDLWRAAVARARSSGQAVTAPFRCDAPGYRRWYRMTITPTSAARVDFRSELVFEVARPEIAVLRRRVRRDPDASTVEVCSWCAAANDGGPWRPIEELLAASRALEREDPPPVSYGVCPSCAEEMASQLGSAPAPGVG